MTYIPYEISARPNNALPTLQNVDVADLQPFEGTLYTIEDMLKISVSEFRAYEDRHEGVYLAIETLLVDYAQLFRSCALLLPVDMGVMAGRNGRAYLHSTSAVYKLFQYHGGHVPL